MEIKYPVKSNIYFFSRSKKPVWICGNCLQVNIKKRKPPKCPVCGRGQSVFLRVSDFLKAKKHKVDKALPL